MINTFDENFEFSNKEEENWHAEEMFDNLKSKVLTKKHRQFLADRT